MNALITQSQSRTTKKLPRWPIHNPDLKPSLFKGQKRGFQIRLGSSPSFRKPPQFQKIANQIARYFPRETNQIELEIVQSERIAQLNAQYRGLNKPTDVLSFPFLEHGILGAIVIDEVTAAQQAKEYGHSFKRELEELFLHALLHLLGFDHEEAPDADLMRFYEDFFINKCISG